MCLLDCRSRRARQEEEEVVVAPRPIPTSSRSIASHTMTSRLVDVVTVQPSPRVSRTSQVLVGRSPQTSLTPVEVPSSSVTTMVVPGARGSRQVVLVQECSPRTSHTAIVPREIGTGDGSGATIEIREAVRARRRSSGQGPVRSVSIIRQQGAVARRSGSTVDFGPDPRMSNANRRSIRETIVVADASGVRREYFR